MRKGAKGLIPYIVLLLVQCRQTYDPRITPGHTGLLIVEGFINSGQGPTTVRLSRSTDVKDTVLHPETAASVSVEGDNNAVYMLQEIQIGEYSVPQLTLDNGARYRVHIRTIDGRDYVSDYSTVRFTPPIDSITWQRENDGLRLYSNAVDPQGASKYYQWKYEETWEFHSAFYSELTYTRDPNSGLPRGLVFRNPDRSYDTTIYRCWNTLVSSSIILGSTEKLTSDVVYLPVQYIEPRSEKLSVLYSINLHQYAISHDNYLFLQKMKKNTEQLGTIFDPQPSELSGNFHCTTNPAEVVVGFVEVTQEQIKRVFIYNSQIPGWNYHPDCIVKEILNIPDTITKYGDDLIPTLVAKEDIIKGIISFFASTIPCVDCTTRGVHQKPPFWP